MVYRRDDACRYLEAMLDAGVTPRELCEPPVTLATSEGCDFTDEEIEAYWEAQLPCA